jgi:hypothetical protein
MKDYAGLQYCFAGEKKLLLGLEAAFNVRITGSDCTVAGHIINQCMVLKL